MVSKFHTDYLKEFRRRHNIKYQKKHPTANFSNKAYKLISPLLLTHFPLLRIFNTNSHLFFLCDILASFASLTTLSEIFLLLLPMNLGNKINGVSFSAQSLYSDRYQQTFCTFFCLVHKCIQLYSFFTIFSKKKNLD